MQGNQYLTVDSDSKPPSADNPQLDAYLSGGSQNGMFTRAYSRTSTFSGATAYEDAASDVSLDSARCEKHAASKLLDPGTMWGPQVQLPESFRNECIPSAWILMELIQL